MKRFVSHLGRAVAAGVFFLHTSVSPLLAQTSNRPFPPATANAGAASAQFASQLTNQTVAVTQRVEAARQWVAASDQLPTVQRVLEQITPISLPDVAGGLLNALAGSQSPDTAGAILNHLANFTPAVRRTAAGVILRRPEWIRALLDAVEQGRLARTEMPPEFWRQLTNQTDRAIATRAGKLAGFKPASSSEAMAALAKKLLPAAEQHGNLARGKELFDQLCLVCHTLGGQGGKIGLDLTGLAARPRSDILLDVIDANRSVEADYRLWTVTTIGEDIYSGRLETETQTSLELLDTTGQKHTVQRKDIAKLEVSQLSVMPVGFEALPVSDLASLLDYLCASFPAPAR